MSQAIHPKRHNPTRHEFMPSIQTHPATQPKPSSSFLHVRTPTTPRISHKTQGSHFHKRHSTRVPAISSSRAGRNQRVYRQSRVPRPTTSDPIFWVKCSSAGNVGRRLPTRGSDCGCPRAPSHGESSDPLSRLPVFPEPTVHSLDDVDPSTSEVPSEPPCSMPSVVRT